MKICYFDCFAGASGDMILGALIDAGLDIKILKDSLEKLKVSGFEISADKTEKKGISGTQFKVNVTKDHKHRNLRNIKEIIQQSTLDNIIKKQSTDIFTNLAQAEAKIHNKPIDQIHFHEVGAIDSIVDIVGSVIGLNILGIDKVVTSRLHVGTGFLHCAHGKLPVPPPATLELLKKIPIYSTGIESELVTPTGAAILTTLTKKYGPLPSMKIDRTGYGVGTRNLQIPNILRIVIGETTKSSEEDSIQLLETNIDDMNPQFYEHIMEALFKQGAKDVFLTPIIMKKNRPGVILSVMAEPSNVQILSDVIFHETTTLGIRISEIKKRWILKREITRVSTQWGPVRVKIRILDDNQKTLSPEYEDCKKIAQKQSIPLIEVYEAVKKAAQNNH